MGLFDDLLKQVDKGLKAVESGALEEKLNKFADTIDKTSKQASSTIEKAADKPGDLLKAAEKRTNELEQKAKDMTRQVGKSMDGLRKKD